MLLWQKEQWLNKKLPCNITVCPVMTMKAFSLIGFLLVYHVRIWVLAPKRQIHPSIHINRQECCFLRSHPSIHTHLRICSLANITVSCTFFEDERAIFGLGGGFAQTTHVLREDPEEVLVPNHQLCDSDAVAMVVLNACVPFLYSKSRQVHSNTAYEYCLFNVFIMHNFS